VQEKSEEKFSHANRLKNLRLERQCNWAEIANDIGLSEGMVYAVIAGKKFLSDKSIHRLQVLESAVGISPPAYPEIKTGGIEIKDGPTPNEKFVIMMERKAERMQAELDEFRQMIEEMKVKP